MHQRFLPLLRCPNCQTTLTLDPTEVRANQILTGTLTCPGGHVYPITRGVPRFVDADQYADSFSRQRLYVRKHFEHYRHDRSGDAQFFPTTGFDPVAIRQGVTLEVGCGYGRFIDVVERAGGTIIGVDLSTHSIELAHDFVGDRPNVCLVQADLFRLPFARQTFDHVYSIGVLHHTPSTERAFAAVAPYVKPNGWLSIWVYHPTRKRTADAWRHVTARLPHRVLYAWCIVNQLAFSWIRALPGGGKFSQIIPGAQPGPNRPFWLRVLGDFDNLSPTYAHTHEPADVVNWFKAAGLRHVRPLDRLTAVTGQG